MITIDFKHRSGIYRIRNSRDENVYVGSAVNLYGRYHRHKFDLIHNKHHSLRLQRFTNKYGFDCLLFEVIEFCQREVLLDREQHWIDTLQPVFNTVAKAGSSIGFRHSAESKARMSKSQKGKPNGMLGKRHTEETKRKLAERRIGKPLHPNLIAASIAANTGRKHTPEEIERRSVSQSKLSKQNCREIWWARKLGIFQKDIARAYGISQRLVARAIHGVGIYGQYAQLDPDYFAAAEKRFANHIAQQVLFVPAAPKPEQLTLV